MLSTKQRLIEERDAWLKENDPALRPKAKRRKPKVKPVRFCADMFQQESAFLMGLPKGSRWDPHPSRDGVVVRIPGQAPFWRRINGSIVK